MDKTYDSNSSDGSIAIPSSSVIPEECERVFSGTKKLVTPERNALAEDIIEACECLKAWRKNSVIEQQEDHVHYENKKPKK
jgi:hypothetical protein